MSSIWWAAWVELLVESYNRLFSLAGPLVWLSKAVWVVGFLFFWFLCFFFFSFPDICTERGMPRPPGLKEAFQTSKDPRRSCHLLLPGVTLWMWPMQHYDLLMVAQPPRWVQSPNHAHNLRKFPLLLAFRPYLIKCG